MKQALFLILKAHVAVQKLKVLQFSFNVYILEVGIDYFF